MFCDEGMIAYMIPKIIHACWFGKNDMPQSARGYVATWKKYNPDYQIILWNEDNFDIMSNQYVREAYQCKKYAFVTDYVRLKVLYDYGGIYMDTDVEVKRSLDDLLNYPAFSGFESEKFFPTGTMGAEPKNRWIKVLLDDYKYRHFLLPNGGMDMTTNTKRITAITQKLYPVILNNTYQELGGDLVLMPFEYLCAKDPVNGKIKETNNTYTVHHFAGSWLPPKSVKARVIDTIANLFGDDFVQRIVKLKHFMSGKDI